MRGVGRFEQLDVAWEPNFEDMPAGTDGNKPRRVPLPVFQKVKVPAKKRSHSHYSLFRMFCCVGAEWCTGTPAPGRVVLCRAVRAASLGRSARIAGGLSSSQDTDAGKLYRPGPKRLSHALTKEFHYEATPQTRGPLLVLQGQLAELLKLMQTGGYDHW